MIIAGGKPRVRSPAAAAGPSLYVRVGVAPSRRSRGANPDDRPRKKTQFTVGRGVSAKLNVVGSTQPEELLFTVAVCREILPDGRRRRRVLEAAARAIFADDFDGRVLPFDATAATLCAELFAAANRPDGQPPPPTS